LGLTFAFHGTKGSKVPGLGGAFDSFKALLVDFVEMIKTSKPRFDWNETIHLCSVIAASVMSRERGGVPVEISEFEERMERQAQASVS
jgi:hypothetical protein